MRSMGRTVLGVLGLLVSACGDEKGGGPPMPKSGNPLRIPAVLEPTTSDATSDTFDLVQSPGTVQLRPGAATDIWGYDGTWPGPTLRVTRGRTAIVRQTNELGTGVTVHLHGAHVAADSDGYPLDLVADGATKTYTYPNDQRAATLWYHDHTMDMTGAQVYRGLAGFYLIDDPAEAVLNLPTGDFDLPLLIQDRSLDAANAWVYDHSAVTLFSGFLGDSFFVNGVEHPYVEVARRSYRLRLLNGSNARHVRLKLGPLGDGSGDTEMLQIASDGGLLPVAVSRSVIPLGPAERVEVLVDFSAWAVGDSVELLDDGGNIGSILRFDIVGDATDSSSRPTSLATVPRLVESDAVATRDWTLATDGSTWRINNQVFDGNRVDASPKVDTVEIWRVFNDSGVFHPFHVHLVQFQVLDINGNAPPPELLGDKDTIDIAPSATVRLIMRFSGFTGRYVFHCHILEHEDHGMMGQVEVVP